MALLVVWISCAACGGDGGHGRPAAGTVPAAGPPAPFFEVSDLAGRSVTLDQLRGHTVILNFWASWCGPCRAEFPSLVSLHRELSGRGLEILAISTDVSARDIDEFLKGTPLPFRVAMDREGKAAASYAVSTLPTTFVLDREGRVIERVDGSVDWSRGALGNTVRALVAGG